MVVIGGARQAGKSTLLGHNCGSAVRSFVFDPVTDVGNARRDPELFLRQHQPPLILDEIQYAPELLSVLKRLVDERPEACGQYFVTGSHQFGVLGAIRETLPGRAVLLDLLPMSQWELADTPTDGLLTFLFGQPRPVVDADELKPWLARRPGATAAPDLFTKMYRGGYPGLLRFATEDVSAWFDSYLRTYIERDVRALRNVESPHDFSRFFRLMAALTAQEVNTAHLGREIGITPRTARIWLSLLAESYQVLVIEAFSGNAIKRVSGRPKAHLVDSGLAGHLLALSSPEALSAHPALGAIFESYVVNEIHKQLAEVPSKPRLWHWRTAGGAEVDLLLERDGVFIPIEIKLTSRPHRRDTRGLQSFAATHPHLRVGPHIVIHGGVESFMINEQTIATPFFWL